MLRRIVQFTDFETNTHCKNVSTNTMSQHNASSGGAERAKGEDQTKDALVNAHEGCRNSFGHLFCGHIVCSM